MHRTAVCSLVIGLALTAAGAQQHAAPDAAVQRALAEPYLSQVRASVEDGAVTLTGSVDLYLAKMVAEKRVSEAVRVPVHNHIQVAGPMVPDRQLKNSLKDAIRRRNIPGAEHASRFLSLRVKKGVVTLEGHCPEPTLAAVALAIARVPGVKDLVLEAWVYPNGLHGEALEWPSGGDSIGGLSVQ